MSIYEFEKFSPTQKAALRKLPHKRVRLGTSVFDPMYASGEPMYEGGDSIEWIVKRGQHTYYVDTEGFDYARYGFEIKGFPE